VGRFKLLPILESNDDNDIELTEPEPQNITLPENTKEKPIPQLTPESTGWWSFFLKKKIKTK